MNWFQRHPNWTWAIAWMVIFGFMFLAAMAKLTFGLPFTPFLVVGIGVGVFLLHSRKPTK
jgi:hypothetical protein